MSTDFTCYYLVGLFCFNEKNSDYECIYNTVNEKQLKQNKFKESLKITKSGPRWSVSLGVWSLGTQWTCWVLQQMFLLQGDCKWSRHRKQGVYFFGSPWEISGDGRAAVSYSFTFEPSLGDIRMDFSVTSQWRRAITDWTAHFLPNLTFNMFCSDWISMINHNSECGTWEA